MTPSTPSLQTVAHPSIFPVPAFSDNYVWAVRRDASSRECLVVDPGDAAPVIAALQSEGLELAEVLITHWHADHTGGVEGLRKQWPGLVVHGPADGPFTDIDEAHRDGDRIPLRSLGAACSVIAVPGHTLDHIAYLIDAFAGDPRKLLFCGDTMFAAGCGRLFEGSPAQMHDSLSRLAALEGDTLVHCAHEYTLANLAFAHAAEPDNTLVAERIVLCNGLRDQGLPTLPSSIALERATNPFLRSGLREVRRQLDNVNDDTDEIEAFATLRRWKDSFRG